MTNDQIRAFIEEAIRDNEVMLFMKGTPTEPRCGFSARTAAALNALGVRYAALDILPDPRIKQELVNVSGWPTSMYTGRSVSSRLPPSSPGLSMGLRSMQMSSDDRSRCSSSGRWVQAVTRYARRNRRGGWRRRRPRR